LFGLLAVALLCGLVIGVQGVLPDPGGGTHPWLSFWSFGETNTWHSDLSYSPLSFTNIYGSPLGDANAVDIDSPSPAWLQYNVNEADGTTNLTLANGSFVTWFAPNWAGTNSGGTGPGQWGRLVEAGSYTTNASYGWWSLYLDADGANVYFSSQTNSGFQTNYFSAPISWTTNYWHMLALTYSSTNTSLYIDGVLVTNGPGTVYLPGPDVLTNGFWLGSDSTGVSQARGMYDDISTYNYPLSSDDIGAMYLYDAFYFYMNPMNRANLSSAAFTNSYTPTFDAISGPGYLLSGTTNSIGCVTDTNIWFTNVVAVTATNGTITLSFTIAGGADGALYDVFANALLGPTNVMAYQWAWMGQGYHCVNYSIANLPPISAYLILGQPIDSDHDGLTDAYEALVSHTSPTNPDTDGDGISDADEVLFHTDPLNPTPAIPAGALPIPTCPL
jgi:hypothetical protein